MKYWKGTVFLSISFHPFPQFSLKGSLQSLLNRKDKHGRGKKGTSIHWRRIKRTQQPSYYHRRSSSTQSGLSTNPTQPEPGTDCNMQKTTMVFVSVIVSVRQCASELTFEGLVAVTTSVCASLPQHCFCLNQLLPHFDFHSKNVQKEVSSRGVRSLFLQCFNDRMFSIS